MKQLWEHVETQRRHLDEGQYLDLLAVLLDNSKVFSKSEYDIGKVKGVKHQFTLVDNVPFKVHHRNVPPRIFVAAIELFNVSTNLIYPIPMNGPPIWKGFPTRCTGDSRYFHHVTIHITCSATNMSILEFPCSPSTYMFL